MKARFDEENNYVTAELMQQSGIKIIYSLPGLKVHAKLAYVRLKSNDPDHPLKGYAYLSTGNFNEKQHASTPIKDCSRLTAISLEISTKFSIFSRGNLTIVSSNVFW